MGTTPTNEEQLALQLINRARQDPEAEMIRLFETGELSIDRAVDFFNVDRDVAISQVRGLDAVAPLAWNTELAVSADNHNAVLLELGIQSHQAPGEPDLGERLEIAGYDYQSAGENVYSYAKSVLHAHAGYYIDWGYGPNGIQDPAGHRNSMLSERFVHVGIAHEEDTNTGNSIGPYVSTQNFGRYPTWKASGQLVNIVGVAINDSDNDDFYDVGEGISGVTVTATGGGKTFTTTTWSSGGYTLEVDPNVTYTVTYSGGELGDTQTFTAAMGNRNLAIDVEAVETLRPSSIIDDFEAGTNTNDVADMGAGNDSFFARAGNDLVFGGSGEDRLFGDAGNDTLNGGSGSDRLFGGDGRDQLRGDGARDTLSGQNGNDALEGGAGNDIAYGGSGDDIIRGGDDNDALFGDTGDDTLVGNEGNDRMFGGADDDVIMGEDGTDTLSGGEGNDYLMGGGGDGKFYGDAGNDTILGLGGTDVVTAGTGNDFVDTSGGNDRIVGQSGNDTLKGGSGNDQLNGGTGADQLEGGGGRDRLIGGDGSDRLEGGGGDDTIFGGAGSDTLNGGAGNDRLDDGAGSDRMTGGSGADTFIIDHFGAASNRDLDVITDLDFSEDILIIRGFDGAGSVTIRDAAALYSLSVPGVTVAQVGSSTRLDFFDTDTTRHSVILEDITDPLLG